MAKPERPTRRMLLVASVGVASVSYLVACGHHDPGAGNAPAPPQTSSPVSGNLMAPQPPPDAGDGSPPPPTATADADAGMNSVQEWLQGSPTAGNLMVHAPASASAPRKPIAPPKRNPVGGNLAPPTE